MKRSGRNERAAVRAALTMLGSLLLLAVGLIAVGVDPVKVIGGVLVVLAILGLVASTTPRTGARP